MLWQSSEVNVTGWLRLTLLAAALTWIACAAAKYPQPIGGSRADGTVQLAYEYGAFENPQVDWESANRLATEKCAAWGYSAAESFGGGVRECTYADQNGCWQYFVTITYQCTGGSSE